LGPALLIGLILFNYLDFPTFLIANIIIDIEPLTVLLMGLDSPLHGFFHSFIGGTIASIILTMIVLRVRKYVSPLMDFFYREQDWTRRKIERLEEGKTISRASIIFFLNRMLDQGVLSWRDATGKGGHHKIYITKLDEHGYKKYVVRTLLESVAKDFPEETEEVLKSVIK